MNKGWLLTSGLTSPKRSVSHQPLTSIGQYESSNLWKLISLKRKNGYLGLFAFVFYYNCR